jgi:hypothetical protein
VTNGGSFPQTPEVRKARADHDKGGITDAVVAAAEAVRLSSGVWGCGASPPPALMDTRRNRPFD